ncbi:sigma-70 family RNA polymerase sigma factor [Rhizobium sp. 2YAF20]|uniref:sigma-70 family RNA polymerase sigma factor n=1 Tax=Rhizobium sp. 2YAF20 TaxID=3233027 RepID=UPI003F967FE5
MTDLAARYFFAFDDRPLRAPPRSAGRTRDKGARLGLLAFFGAVREFAAMAAATGFFSQSKSSAAMAASQGTATQRFQQTVMPHLDSAYNFARFLCRDADAAQDIVQDAFLRAFRSFEGYRGGDPRAWLFSIVRNCYHAWLQQRRRKTRVEVPLDDKDADTDTATMPQEFASGEESAETAMIRDTEAQRVRAVINTLPEAMREVLILREFEDLSYRQIAEIIDAPIGTVMSRLARAREDFGQAWLEAEKYGLAR